jgi:hypothetical protein
VGWPGWAFALLGPGRGPVGLDSSTPFFVLILFHFLLSFPSITFAFVTQMTSNQMQKFYKI